jgi:hypothetical protein
MHTNRSFLSIASRAAAFTFLIAGTASLMHAQQATSASSSAPAPILVTAAAPADLAFPADASSASSSSSSSSSYSSSSMDSLPSDPSSLADGLTQPPPRRRYGRPNYSDSHTNADGSNKFTFIAGAGLSSPVADTGNYLTSNFAFQVGAGRNWSKKFGALIQFDYDKFGFQGSTLKNQQNLYDQGLPTSSPYYISNLDGTSHVWSFTIDPKYTFYDSDKYGAYIVAGVGFYHKTANFFVPTAEEVETYFGPEEIAANETVDKYTSNAPGFSGGFGVTYKPSRFSGERFYLEARYVFVDNSARAASVTNYYPPNANQTYYVPATFGLRF